MKDYNRRVIAYIVGRLLSSRAATSVYDYATSRHHSIEGEVSDRRVNIFDHERKRLVSGNGNGQSISLFEIGGSQFIHLEFDLLEFRGFDYSTAGGVVTSKSIDDEVLEFRGFDYSTAGAFSGEVNGDNVSFYDFLAGQQYHFRIA